MINNNSTCAFSKQQFEEWPIFAVEINYQNESFWDKALKFKFDPKSALISDKLMRIGKNKQIPKEYRFALLTTGVLLYFNEENQIKGMIQLNLTRLIKKVELINQDQEQQKIITIRLERKKHCQIYLWHAENQIMTNNWYKQFAQFCISQNFEGFYRINGTIDQGAFSTVFSVTPTFPETVIQQVLAAKVYSKELMQKIPAKQMKVINLIKQEFITAECEILKLTNSEYIIKLFEVIQLEDVVILIFENITGGTLSNFVKQNLINELVACEICNQIVQGLKVVHQLGYVHRDIKLDNILIAKHNPILVKIIDFGFAEQINRVLLTNGQGTAGYIAPELFEKAPYTENCDIFSLGIVFYILLTGSLPFRSANYETLLERNKACQIRFQSDDWRTVSSSAQRMVQRMLEKDPVKRITLQELLILLDLHISNLKQSTNTRVSTNHIQSTVQMNKTKTIGFEIIEKSPQKLVQSIKQQPQEEDENYIQEISIDDTNLKHLQESQLYYNKCKWK